MTEAILSVKFAGPHVSVQDGGRPGFMRFGVPMSGPMDRLSFAAANIAAGNPPDAPAIEISLGGLTLSCLSGRVDFAVAGGGFIIEHAGQRRGSWSAATLETNESLTIRPGHWGSWCYLALAGQVQATSWLGSVATHALSDLGGGRLATGQRLQVTAARVGNDGSREIPCPVIARHRHHIRVTLGPQERFFGDAAIEALLNEDWSLTQAWDRMGVRLSGPAIPPDAVLDMPSEPIARGSVQVAGDGVATVLLADHQTTGGYPKIATVLDCDLDALVQGRPADPLRFHAVTPDEAIKAARSAAATRERYLARLAPNAQA